MANPEQKIGVQTDTLSNEAALTFAREVSKVLQDFRAKIPVADFTDTTAGDMFEALGEIHDGVNKIEEDLEDALGRAGGDVESGLNKVEFGSEECYWTIFRFLNRRLYQPFFPEDLHKHLQINGYDMTGVNPAKMMDEIMEWGAEDFTADAANKGVNACLVYVGNGEYAFAEGPGGVTAPNVTAAPKEPAVEVWDEPEDPEQDENTEESDSQEVEKSDKTKLTENEEKTLAFVRRVVGQSAMKLSQLTSKMVAAVHNSRFDNQSAKELLDSLVFKGELYTYRNEARYYTFNKDLADAENEHAAQKKRDLAKNRIDPEEIENGSEIDVDLAAGLLSAFTAPRVHLQQWMSVEEVAGAITTYGSPEEIKRTARQLEKLGLMEVAKVARGGQGKPHSKARKQEVLKMRLLSPEVKNGLKNHTDVGMYLRQLIGATE